MFCYYCTSPNNYLLLLLFLPDPREWSERQVLLWAQWLCNEYQLPLNPQVFQVFVVINLIILIILVIIIIVRVLTAVNCVNSLLNNFTVLQKTLVPICFHLWKNSNLPLSMVSIPFSNLVGLPPGLFALLRIFWGFILLLLQL